MSNEMAVALLMLAYMTVVIIGTAIAFAKTTPKVEVNGTEENSEKENDKASREEIDENFIRWQLAFESR